MPAVGECALPPHPRVPSHYVINAAYDRLVSWIESGTPPPIAPQVTTADNVIQRDSFGNALGGIRLGEFDPPTAINGGTNTGAAFCVLYGHYLPFDETTLSALYPTQGSYVAAVDAATESNLQAGYIVLADAEATRTRAARSIVGQGTPCGATCRAAQDLLEQTNYYLFTAERGAGLANVVSGAVADISAGDGEKARRALERFREAVRRLESDGAVSSTSAAELTESASAIIGSLGLEASRPGSKDR